MKIKTKTKSEKLVEEKHAQIAQAAVSLFIKKGFNQTSIREIAEAAGMSMGLLYKYISSKDDVLYLAYEEIHKENIKGISSPVIERSQDPGAKLINSIKSVLEQVHRDPKKYLFVYTESKFLNREALKAVLKKEALMIEHFRNIIEEGVKTGLFNSKSALLDASIITLLLMLEPLRGWGYRSRHSHEEVRSYITEFCLRALSADNGKKPEVRKQAKKIPRSK